MNKLVERFNMWLKSKGLYERPNHKGSRSWFQYWAFWIALHILGMVIVMLVIVGFKGLLMLVS